MKLGIIPARGGSKRVPGKNLRLFAGKPIIAYAIEAALDAQVFDHVLVSTDSDKIAQVAARYGASVPFRRPADLCDDITPLIPVLRHSLEWADAHLGPVRFACCLYATAPFIRSSDIQEGLRRLLADPSADFAFGVTTFPFPIFRSVRILSNRVHALWPEYELTRSQDLPEAFHDAAHFTWGTRDAFFKWPYYNSNAIPVVLPRRIVQDIDTQEDWEVAEQMYLANADRRHGDDLGSCVGATNSESSRLE